MPVKIERRFLAIPEHKESKEAETLKVELREAEGQTTKIVGYTAVFNQEIRYDTWFGSFKEKISKNAFSRALEEKHDVRALRNHEPDNLLGRTKNGTLTMRADDNGLFVEITPGDTTIGKDTIEMIKRGDLSGMSFAFVVTGESWKEGKDGEPDMRTITDLDLYDVGPVTYPAYDETTAGLRDLSETLLMGKRSLHGDQIAEISQVIEKVFQKEVTKEVIVEEKAEEVPAIVVADGEGYELDIQRRRINLQKLKLSIQK